jgi:hypothetical protein
MHIGKHSTAQVLQLYLTKQAILQEWEARPVQEQLANQQYITELARNVRKLRSYLTHRKDSPI